MMRRGLLWLPMAATSLGAAERPVIVPVRHVLDRRAVCTATELERFSDRIWPEAFNDFARCGVQLQRTSSAGEIRRSPSDQPVFTDLDRGALNMVLTDLIPMAWDRGRGLAGVSTRWQGYHLSVISLRNAHGHLIPFVSVNTCVHEILHALLQDIYEVRAGLLYGEGHEVRVDFYATQLWLFHDAPTLRGYARAYIDRLKAG